MTFSQFISILRARWLTALNVLVATVAITIVLSLVFPKQYTATASVLVDIRPDPVSAMAFPAMVQPAILATQVDVIASDRVARRVVQNLKLLENPAVRQQFQDDGGVGSIETWMVDQLTKKLDVKPSRESSVINVSYRAPDPNFAAGVANAFVQAYLQTTLELKVNPARQYSTFFEQQAKDARASLERAQTKLSDYQQKNGIVASDERLDVENARLAELSTQLVMIEALASESRSRQAQAAGGAGDRMQEVLNNAVVASLKSDISRGEARLQELSTRYGDSHPQVVEAKANLAELRTRLETETRRVASGVGVTDKITRQREAQTRADLEAQRAKVLKLKAVRDDIAVLMKDVDNAQRTYDAVVGRLNQSSLESQSTQSNINFLTPAQPPNEASFPKLGLNLILSVVVGLLLGIGSSMLRELRDRKLRTVEDVRTLIDLPVLAVLPSGAAKVKKNRRMELLTEQRLLGGMQSQGKGA